MIVLASDVPVRIPESLEWRLTDKSWVGEIPRLSRDAHRVPTNITYEGNMIEPHELTTNGKLRWATLEGSDHRYPRATKRCRACGYFYAPFTALWSKEPDVCAICAAPIQVRRGK